MRGLKACSRIWVTWRYTIPNEALRPGRRKAELFLMRHTINDFRADLRRLEFEEEKLQYLVTG